MKLPVNKLTLTCSINEFILTLPLPIRLPAQDKNLFLGSRQNRIRTYKFSRQTHSYRNKTNTNANAVLETFTTIFFIPRDKRKLL